MPGSQKYSLSSGEECGLLSEQRLEIEPNRGFATLGARGFSCAVSISARKTSGTQGKDSLPVDGLI